jgi:antitoxin (DNA-binding transcriptional repressor) of toxin-antitoxin stability system
MRRIGAFEAKTHLSSLLDAVDHWDNVGPGPAKHHEV